MNAHDPATRSVVRPKRKRPLSGLRKLLFRGSKDKDTMTLVPTLNKENTFPNNAEDALLVSPEQPKPKRVSLLDQEEAQISKKLKNKKKKAPKAMQSANTDLHRSLLDQKDPNVNQSNIDECEDNSTNELLKLRQELQHLRNQLNTNDSPCGSPQVPKTIQKHPKQQPRRKKSATARRPRQNKHDLRV